jgi:hypothetical protein
VDSASPTPDSSLHHLNQLKGSFYRTLPHDVTSNLTAISLFAICPYDVSQFSLRGGVDNIGGGNLLAGAEAHV